MKVYLGADHGGFKMKTEIKQRLLSAGYEVIDLGAEKLASDDDYVEYAALVGEEIAFDEDARGVLFCRNGVGVSIVANRFAGVRCALGFELAQIERARRDDDVNCLALPADYMDVDKGYEIVMAFLKTEFEREDKYVRRLSKLALMQTHGCCGGGCGGCRC